MNGKNYVFFRGATVLAAAAALFAALGGTALFALRGSGAVNPPWPDVSTPASPVGGGGQDAAVIISIEEYRDLPRLSGADANAWAWFDHFNKTRGLPGTSMITLLGAEATAEGMKEAASRAAGLAGPGGTLWFVFIGYGAPDGLLAADARLNERGMYSPVLPQKELLAFLSAGKAGAVAVVLDACVPGKNAGAGGPAAVPDRRFTVLSAGGGCPGRLPGAERPALSYLALGGLRGWADADGDRQITVAELRDFAAQAFPGPASAQDRFPLLAGTAATLLGASAGEKGPDMARMGKTETSVVNSGLVFRAGLAPVVAKGMETRAWTRDTDWNKLSRMLLYADGNGKKKELAAAFVKAHGTGVDENPYVVYLVPFLDMALIPAGGFFMGSPEKEGGADESPRHEVDLDAFCIDKYEVTAADYKIFSAATGRSMPEQSSWSTDRHPVVNVDWDSASAYCEWAGKRLPTEAEWEKAARGGAVTRYSFGDDENKLGDYAWYHANADGQSHPVGLKTPNQYGLYDMAGNVWEWTADRYGMNYYKASPVKNPKGPGSGTQRALRGGSWSFFDVSPRPGDRGSDFPSTKSQRGGFRCAF